MSIYLVFIFFVLILFRIPIGFALIGASFITILIDGRFPLIIVAERMTSGIGTFILLAIPFFVLAGQLMNTGGITRRIFNFANSSVGFIAGGLAHANVLASMIFSGMSGSAVADAGGLGTIEMKAMEDAGYDPEFGAAITAASATVGPIVPPSIPFVVYATIAEVSIGALFLGGILPGICLGLSLMIFIYIVSVKRGYQKTKFNFITLLKTFKEAFWAMLTPVILIGGIVGGVTTPTEAAVVAVVYAIFLGFFVYKELTIVKLSETLVESMVITASILLIMAGARAFSWIIAIDNIPGKLAGFIIAADINRYLFLFMMNILFLVLGTFMEGLSVMIITVPVLTKVFHSLGIDPLQMGVVITLNLMIGLITPPVGESLFMVSQVGNIKLEKVYKAILPFIIPLVTVLLLITYIPALVTWIPSMFYK
jgi:tripartite ATP-independent transporter DctM subunit